jgi:hypothetical protein
LAVLTRKQQNALLALDDPEIDLAVIDSKILRELIGVGFLLKREDGRYDLTDKGREECERIKKQ